MSYYELYYHLVFATKGRRRLITPAHKRELYAYIYGICKQKKCTVFRINGMDDHVHILLTIPPSLSISDVVKDIKQCASLWARSNTSFGIRWYGWGKGYAVKSYSRNDLATIKQYIINQEEHHKKMSFYEEFKQMVEQMGYTFIDEEETARDDANHGPQMQSLRDKAAEDAP